jgi:hypothetical protein
MFAHATTALARGRVGPQVRGPSARPVTVVRHGSRHPRGARADRHTSLPMIDTDARFTASISERYESHLVVVAR